MVKQSKKKRVSMTKSQKRTRSLTQNEINALVEKKLKKASKAKKKKNCQELHEFENLEILTVWSQLQVPVAAIAALVVPIGNEEKARTRF